MSREVAHGVRDLKRQPPSDQLEEQTAGGVQVAARLWKTSCLLGGHVRRRAHNEAGLCEPVRGRIGVGRSSHTEIEDLRHAGRRDEDVGRLDVPVHDSGVVRVCKRVTYLSTPSAFVRAGDGALAQHRIQALASNQLHREERGPVALRLVGGCD